MSQQLSYDLQTTYASGLIRVDHFGIIGFGFAASRLKMEIMKWDAAILTSLNEAITHYETKVLVVLKMLLPELAKGLFVQRGSIFGFEDYNASCPRLVIAMNQEQLSKTPINNMSLERCWIHKLLPGNIWKK